MNLNLDNKVCIISGSSRGIGRGIANALMQEGARVVLTGRAHKELNRTYEELSLVDKTRVLAVEGDLNCDENLKRVEQVVLQCWGRIDRLVANAGAVRSVSDWNISNQDWHWYFNANFHIAHRFVTRFIPYLIDSKGCIVFIGSIAGIEEIGAPLPYSSAKAALSMYAKGLARRLAGKNVRVNLINPGNVYFEGGNWAKRMKSNPDETLNLIKKNVPMNKFASLEDIAVATLFFLSDKTRFITGSSLAIDGGQNSLFI